VLAGLAVSLVAEPSFAAFPDYDPAYLFAPLPAPPEVFLPLNRVTYFQNVDGHVHPLEEYANGKRIILDDWETGLRPGDAHIVWSGADLQIGMRIDLGKCNQLPCGVVIAIDEYRHFTLAAHFLG